MWRTNCHDTRKRLLRTVRYQSPFRDTWMFQGMNACVVYAGVVGGTLAVQAGRQGR